MMSQLASRSIKQCFFLLSSDVGDVVTRTRVCERVTTRVAVAIAIVDVAQDHSALADFLFPLALCFFFLFSQFESFVNRADQKN